MKERDAFSRPVSEKKYVRLLSVSAGFLLPCDLGGDLAASHSQQDFVFIWFKVGMLFELLSPPGGQWRNNSAVFPFTSKITGFTVI